MLHILSFIIYLEMFFFHLPREFFTYYDGIAMIHSNSSVTQDISLFTFFVDRKKTVLIEITFGVTKFRQ